MKYIITFLVALYLSIPSVLAQCGAVNRAFSAGEEIGFNLYFNWKFVWIKVGTAKWNITQEKFAGFPAYHTYLTTTGTRRADRYFMMRDTLSVYNNLELLPLYYQKDGIEGKQYRHEKVWYSYPDNQCHLRLYYQRDDKPQHWKTFSSEYCAFDMLSMMLRARSYDPSDLKPGQRQRFLMAEGRKAEWKDILYRGKETINIHKSNKRFRCLVFSYLEKEEGKEKEIVRFFITDDDNHLPVRVDMNLNFGSAKAFISHYKGLRHPLSSLIKKK